VVVVSGTEVVGTVDVVSSAVPSEQAATSIATAKTDAMRLI
jgi:hypothetical protein